jgi:hypothetical protein
LEYSIFINTRLVAAFHIRISEVPKERSGAESEHQAVNELDPTTYAKV